MAHNLWGEYDDLKKKYIRIFETVTERDFRKKSKAREHIQNDATLRSGFFIPKTRSVMVPRFVFFLQDSRIRVELASDAIRKHPLKAPK